MPEEFNIILQDPNTEKFEFRISNDVDDNGNQVPHRLHVTGTDWDGKYMTVNGSMPTVVHGFEGPNSNVGYTLVIFEWSLTRNTNKKRFREVTLQVAFEASGSRREAEPQAEDLRSRGTSSTYWDPEVVSLAPLREQYYQKTPHRITNNNRQNLALKAGYAPFLVAGGEYLWARTDSYERTSAITISGGYHFAGKPRNTANAAIWRMLENPGQTTGVPAFLRTAVLLKRRPNDDGQFLCTVTADYKISKWENLKRSILKARGKLPTDQPILFDPNVATEESSFHPKSNDLSSLKSKLDDCVELTTLEPEKGATDEKDDVGGNDDDDDDDDDYNDEDDDSDEN